MVSNAETMVEVVVTGETGSDIGIVFGPDIEADQVLRTERELLEAEDLKSVVRRLLTELKRVNLLNKRYNEYNNRRDEEFYKKSLRSDGYLKELEDKITDLRNENRDLSSLLRQVAELKEKLKENRVSDETLELLGITRELEKAKADLEMAQLDRKEAECAQETGAGRRMKELEGVVKELTEVFNSTSDTLAASRISCAYLEKDYEAATKIINRLRTEREAAKQEGRANARNVARLRDYLGIYRNALAVIRDVCVPEVPEGILPSLLSFGSIETDGVEGASNPDVKPVSYFEKTVDSD